MSKNTADKALIMLRTLPRVSLGNIRDNPGSKMVSVFNLIYFNKTYWINI